MSPVTSVLRAGPALEPPAQPGTRQVLQIFVLLSL